MDSRITMKEKWPNTAADTLAELHVLQGQSMYTTMPCQFVYPDPYLTFASLAIYGIFFAVDYPLNVDYLYRDTSATTTEIERKSTCRTRYILSYHMLPQDHVVKGTI